jgi:hypothetical protein
MEKGREGRKGKRGWRKEGREGGREEMSKFGRGGVRLSLLCKLSLLLLLDV